MSPRPNPPRTIIDEASLARRIAHEREAAGMSYEGLASRMTQLGCPIAASALYKIEKGEPPRKINAAELLAFAALFDYSVEELCLPVELADVGSDPRLKELWESVQTWEASAALSQVRHAEAWSELEAYLEQWPGAKARLKKLQQNRAS